MTEKRKKDKMNTEQAIPEPRTESIKKIRRDACISFTEIETVLYESDRGVLYEHVKPV